MGTNSSDIKFTFDSSQFKQAMTEMSKSMGGMQTNTKNMTSKISAGAFKAIAMAKILFASLKSGFQAVMGQIPEIGTAFGIAKNIILKNLLYPLRMAIIPVLQNMLSWVRNNRKLFVELGQVLVNAFKMVKTVLLSLYNMVSPIIDMIKNVLKSIFGDTVKSISETLNLIMIKIMVFGMMVSNVLKPLFKGLADVIEGVVGVAKKLAEGFFSMFDKSNAIDYVRTLGTLFSSLKDTLNTLEPVFKVLGSVIGGAVNVIVDEMKILVHTLQFVLGAFNLATHKGNVGDAWKEYKKNIAGDVTTGGTARTIEKLFPGEGKTPAGASSSSNSVNVGNLNIHIPQGGDPIKYGEGFMQGMRNAMLNQQVLENP